jgi:hypothetical protein
MRLCIISQQRKERTMKEETRSELAHTLAVRLDLNGQEAEIVHGGYRWRVALRSDEWCDVVDEINGVDCWGKVARVEVEHHTGYPKPRPDGFDGLAEKINDPRGGAWWWQPTLDVWGISPQRWREDAGLRRMSRQGVADLLEYGFYLLTVERYVLECPACKCDRHVSDWTIGGIEPFPEASYLADIIEEAISECEAQGEVAA